MRLASVRTTEGIVLGVVDSGLTQVAVLESFDGSVDDVVRGIFSLEEVRTAANEVEPVALSTVRLAPPLRRFNRDILCTGWNYLDHFLESSGKREGQDPPKMPDHPTFFTKGPDTVIGPYDAIAYDAELSAKWDYEAEIAIVIGRDGRSIPEEEALDHVFGYFLANDVSQRDLQRAYGGQWLKGKSVDATMPIGPWVTVAAEIDEVSLPIECILNGEQMQRATAADMAFSIPRILSELSRGMTLRAGDVVLTGTPSGIGNAREPAIYLKDGDEVVVRSAPLGELRNKVLATSLVR